ncbi:regulatory helix-turn-helix protein, lysR family [Pseudomonas sp. NFACC37-1]|nr:regulatory helix-turn-helix protein, lysR family [Pseudomonas sp. NFACC37-1]
MARHHEMLIFHALSQCPSLASAAQRLNVSGPTVMRAVARLEARLGVQLLSRSTRGVVLTEAGVGFMADCSRILKAVDEAEASAKGWHVQAQGNLTILLPTLFSRYVMAPVLAHYHDRFPNMHEEGLDVAVLVGHLPSCSLIARPHRRAPARAPGPASGYLLMVSVRLGPGSHGAPALAPHRRFP